MKTVSKIVALLVAVCSLSLFGCSDKQGEDATKSKYDEIMKSTGGDQAGDAGAGTTGAAADGKSAQEREQEGQ